MHRRDFIITWGLVARIPLFQTLTASEIADVMTMLRAQRVDRGTVIARRGEPAHAMYLIADGEVEVKLQHKHLRLGTGQFFGEIAALRRTRRSATVTAVTPTRLLVLDALDLHALGLARGVYGDFHAHADVHGDAEKVDVEEIAAERIDLPIFDNGGLVLAGEVHLEKRVVAGGGAENRADLLGVYRKRDGFAFAAIEDGGDLARQAETLGLVFAPIGAGRSFYDDLCLSHAFIPSVKTLTS